MIRPPFRVKWVGMVSELRGLFLQFRPESHLAQNITTTSSRQSRRLVTDWPSMVVSQ